MRTEFGYERTICGCSECAKFCKTMPSYLIPADIARIYNEFKTPATNIIEFYENYFLASPGAIVISDGRMFRIPTIVPARKENGSCIFLYSIIGECTIHSVAPYGCAFFDTHQRDGEAQTRSIKGLNSILTDTGGLYQEIWRTLYEVGKTTQGPEVMRERL